MNTKSPTSGVDRVSSSRHWRAAIGNARHFWLWSTRTGFDITHPKDHTLKPIDQRITLETTTTPITFDPDKAALVVIDMQNFFLSEAFGRNKGAGHVAADKLIHHAIPAAREAKIQVIWLNWGLTEEDITSMPPAVKRAFGFEAVAEENPSPDDGFDGEKTKAHPADDFSERPNGISVDKLGNPRLQSKLLVENGKDVRIYKGLGSDCGIVTLEDGSQVDAGRLLMRDQWNTALWPPLDELWREGSKLETKPDVWIHKDRMSGMWGARTDCEDFLEKQGIRTLFFAGVNTDQCVAGTLTDCFNKGYDCVMLTDCCGTTSPGYAQQCIEHNAAKTWGFATTSEALLNGVRTTENRR